MTTGFFWDERCFWHGGGNYAGLLQVGGLIQPGGGLPENPETKRRLVNLLRVTGLWEALDTQSADPATQDDLLRVHPESYLRQFKDMSDAGGGELGLRTPFGPGGYEIATLSAGLAKTALASVLNGTHQKAYALSRPPGHHCMPDFPNGFCLLANIAIAVEAARAQALTDRVAIIDWDVHHGNGTEAIYYDRADTLTISLHQERNYPLDTGDFADRGSGAGEGFNLNIPLPPGTGHVGYVEAFERLVLPALHDFQPDAIVIACGFDAGLVDPLSRMITSSETFRALTDMAMEAASDLCDGRLMMAHEGGYSEVHVPFLAHSVLEAMSGSDIHAEDPFLQKFEGQQPTDRFNRYVSQLIAEMEEALGY